MRIFIEFLCRFVFRKLVAWREVNEFVEKVTKTKKFTEKELWIIRIGGYFSAFVHRNENRADGSKYITHPLAVAEIIIFEFQVFDLETILAAIFHDNAENSGWSWGTMFFVMEKISNDRVPSFVFFLSKHYITAFGRVYFEMLYWARIIRVILVKLADRTHNLRTLEFMSIQSQWRKLAETEQYFPSLITIITQDIMLKENEHLAKNVVDAEDLPKRCKAVFDTAFQQAREKIVTD
jgi:(p)ppGpp synthase/HD superfamily hydrolase